MAGMDEDDVDDLCRITVDGPHRRIDIALPVQVAFAQLMPVVLRFSGHELAESGLQHDGWVLQRIDEDPIDMALTPAQVSLKHGDVLYLRPATNRLPRLSFDDTADGTSPSAKEGQEQGLSEWPRIYGAFLVATACLTMAGVAALAGPPWPLFAATAGIVSAVLVIAAIVVSRAYRDTLMGAVCGLGALPVAMLCGITAPLNHASLTDAGPSSLAFGFGAVALTALLATGAVTGVVFVFTGVALSGTIGAVAAVFAVGLDHVAAGDITAWTIVAVVPFSRLMALSADWARSHIPQAPAGLEESLVDDRTTAGETSKPALGNHITTGATLTIGIVSVAAQVPLALDEGWPGRVMCAVTALTLLLRSRGVHGHVRRFILAASAALGLGVLAVAATVRMSQYATVGLLGAVLAVTGAVAVASVSLHRRPATGGLIAMSRIQLPAASWKRAIGLAEGLAGTALILLAMVSTGAASALIDLVV
jgi:type VII secretion integral membrane protein EccD